jgi:hypothetical protein
LGGVVALDGAALVAFLVQANSPQVSNLGRTALQQTSK